MKSRTIAAVFGCILVAACIVIAKTDSAPSTPVAPPSASAAEPSAAQPTAPSDWTLTQSTNPVTGVVTTVAETAGEHNIVVRLIGKKLECYISTPDFLETVAIEEGASSSVQYRFDNGPVIRQGWALGADNTSLFGESHCTAFIAALRKSKQLAFEYKPADTVATTSTFDVAGFPTEFVVR